MEINFHPLYDEEEGENFFYYLFTNQNFHVFSMYLLFMKKTTK